MGCDIHLFVEKRVNGNWEAVKGRSSWYDYCIKKGIKTETEEFCYVGWLYDGRNYELFSLLAGVRNGVDGWRNEPKTGREIKPINIKGYPFDSSSIVKEYMEDDCDLHSFNWATLKELQEIDWNEEQRMACLVDPESYLVYKKDGMPDSWCGGSSAYLVSNEDMDKYINGEDVIGIKNGNQKEVLNISDNRFVQTLLDFYTPLSNLCDFRKEIGKLEMLLDENTTNEDIRIVFAFDN